jgi:branched-chain amino acid transport system substrate-binding protein
MRRLVCVAVVAWLAATVSGVAVPPSLAGERSKPHSPTAATTQDFRIGLLLAGGPHAAVADDIAAGLDLALAEAGRAVDRRHVVVVREDGNGGPADAATRAKGLALAGAVDVLVGPATRTEIPALRDAADEAQVPVIVPVPEGALAPARCSPYVFHLVPSDDQVAGLVGAWVGARKPTKRVYVLVPEDKPARADVAAFERQFEAAGGEIVGQESVSGSDPEFGPYLAKLRLVGADTIYAPFSGATAKALANDFEALGLDKHVAFVGGATGAPADNGGIRAVDYVSSLDTPENRRFRAEFAKHFGRPPSEHAARGYDAGRLIIEALRAAHEHADEAGGFASLLAQASFVGPRGTVRGAALDQVYIVGAPRPAAANGDELLDRVEPTSPAPAESCHLPARS